MNKTHTKEIPPEFVPISKNEIIERLNKIEPDISKETIDSYKNIF